MTDSSGSLTALQAAARLGVKPATLYAYVSRGLVVRHVAADGRTSLFDPADIARLERRPRRRGSPTEVVVASELTLVDTEAGRLFYRGLDAVELARTRRFEEIAGFLWTGNFDGTGPWATRRAVSVPDDAPTFERMRLVAATRRSGSPIACATDLMSSLIDALPGRTSRGSFAERLWTKLGATRGNVRLLDTALSLTADHGLTYSSLIARVAAAGGADVAACVSAAMSAGAASIASSRFGAIESALASGGAIDNELLATDPYRDGDPRGAAMLTLLHGALPDEASVVRRMAGDRPSAVVAQAAIAWACGMEHGSSEIISLLSRVAGWIAHVFEEYRRPTPFRPRLAYIGPAPRATPMRMLDAVQGYLARE